MTPEQRSDGAPPRLPRILFGIIAALTLTAVIVIASDPGTKGSVVATTLPTASESTTSSTTAVPISTSPSSSTTTTLPGRPLWTPIGEYVAGLGGGLVTLQGQGSMLLITRNADSPETTITPVPGWGNDVTFDASGESIGMTVSVGDEPDHLFLGNTTDLIDTRFLVTSYAWQQSEPGEVATLIVDDTRQVWHLNTFTWDAMRLNIRDQKTIAGFDSPKRIRAWTDAGFVLSGFDETDRPFLELIDPEGQTVWQQAGEIVDVSSQGEILVRRSTDDPQEVVLVDPAGSSEVLDWAPTDFNAAGWSTSGEMVAFVGYGGENGTDWRLNVYARNGAHVNTATVPWRVWDVQWSPDERFILMPGTDNQDTQAVIFYDRHTDTLSAVDDFQDWVQWSDLLP